VHWLVRIAGLGYGWLCERCSLAPISPDGNGGLSLVSAQEVPVRSVVDLGRCLAGMSVDVLV
jgi:hypothetical protein